MHGSSTIHNGSMHITTILAQMTSSHPNFKVSQNYCNNVAKLTANRSLTCKHVYKMLCEQPSVPDGGKIFTLTMTEVIGQMLGKVFAGLQKSPFPDCGL